MYDYTFCDSILRLNKRDTVDVGFSLLIRQRLFRSFTVSVRTINHIVHSFRIQYICVLINYYNKINNRFGGCLLKMLKKTVPMKMFFMQRYCNNTILNQPIIQYCCLLQYLLTINVNFKENCLNNH